MKIRTSLIGLGAAAALTLSACGSAEDASSDTEDTGDTSSTGTGDTGDSGDTGGGETGALTETSFAQTVTDAQLDAGSMHLEMTIGVAGQEITASGDVETPSEDPAETEMDLSLDLAGISSEIRLVDGTGYISLGELTDDKFFATDDLASLGIDAQGYSPTTLVDGFDGAIDSFEDTGETEEIDGVETTRYRLEVDGEALGDLAGSDAASGAAALPSTIPVDLWIGTDDDLLRRMTMSFEVQGQSADIEVEASKWGEPVEVEAPAASEITKQNPFAGAGGGL